jgi:hypothetical protein
MWQTLRTRVKEGVPLPRTIILSAKYGIIGPKKLIEPYNQVIDAERRDHFLQPAELDKLVAELQALLKGDPKIRDVQIAGGEHYRAVMRAVVQRVIAGGDLIEAGASVRETTGRGIGDHRAALNAYLTGFLGKPPAAPTGPAPDMQRTPAAERAAAIDSRALDEWEVVKEGPTDEEIEAAGRAVKPGMFMHMAYGFGVNHEVVAVVTHETHANDPRYAPAEEIFTQLHTRDPARGARAKLSYHGVFLRDGKLYETTPDWGFGTEEAGQNYQRVYVLDGPMDLSRKQTEEAPEPAEPAAPVRASRETIELRKRVVAVGKLIDCLKGKT